MSKPSGYAGGRQARLINVHHHFLPQAYMKAVGDRLAIGRGRQRATGWSASQDVENMDAAGIALSFASVAIPGVWFGEAEPSRRLAREWNEFAAQTILQHPGRFGFFAAIAPPDVEGSLKEIEYALDVLKADGVALMSSYDGKWLGDDVFRPVLDELNTRKAIAFVHPAGVGEECTPHGIKAHILEGPFDTTRAIASLLCNGALSTYPEIRYIFAHGGGAMPYLAGRLATLSNGVGDMEPARIHHLLGRLYFDTALIMNAPALTALMSFCSPSRVLLGVDSPIISPQAEVGKWLDVEMQSDLRRLIEWDNAIGLFRTQR